MKHAPAIWLVIGGLPSRLVNFRGPLLRAMREKGYEVVAAASGRDADTEAKLREMGVAYHPFRMARAGMNPLDDLTTLVDLVRLIRRVKPDTVLNYTIKPVVYGGLAARMCGVKAIYSLVSGLGYAFMPGQSPKARLAGWVARRLYRLSLKHSRRVFFQNSDDARAFVDMKLVAARQVVLVDGSGVDFDRFPAASAPRIPGDPADGGIRFLLIARLLKDKGICEYADAARKLRPQYPQAEFHLAGPFDPNPAALTSGQVESWKSENLIRFHGEQGDVRPFLGQCHVYVLPSYREGIPRTVLEAMATGRAIITTDAPGCRETVRKPIGGQWIQVGKLKIGANGILVPPRDGVALAEALEYSIRHPGTVVQMGAESRRYAEERFDARKVAAEMLEAMQDAERLHDDNMA